MTDQPLCTWCRQAMTPGVRKQGGGPRRRFCSPACKQAEYRHRRDPDRYPDAQTWAVRRLHQDAGLTDRPNSSTPGPTASGRTKHL